MAMMRHLRDWVGRWAIVGVVAGVGLAAESCHDKPIVETETHFVKCATTSDCTTLGVDFSCVGGHCTERIDADAQAGGRSNEGGGASGAAGQATWVGAPCEQCDLATQIPQLADPASEDCGIATSVDSVKGADCAHAALQSGRPFTLTVEQMGIDSTVRTVWVWAAQELSIVSYDSNVCGGAASCERVGCGPSVSAQTCVGPVASSSPGTIFDCGSLADSRVICGPTP